MISFQLNISRNYRQNSQKTENDLNEADILEDTKMFRFSHFSEISHFYACLTDSDGVTLCVLDIALNYSSIFRNVYPI